VRADRLVAILLMLQQRGKVTAAEVAAELEISERTARRDLDALGVAGLPIYATQGRGGGWQLAGGGRTDLSGLTAPEARALFLVAGPSSSATPEVKAALRKLVRALPEPMRDAAERAATSIVVDPAAWDQTVPQLHHPPHLDAVQQAVVDGEQLVIDYTARLGAATVRTVHPLGVAAKGGSWYLVASTDKGLRTFRVDRIASLERTGEPVVRPDGFVLGEAWQLIADELDAKRAPVEATAQVDADILAWVRWTFGGRVRIGPADPDAGGRVEVHVRGESVEHLAAAFAGFAGRAEVVSPAAVRSRLAAIAGELAALYP
jgi:predicted DNA-binding transcriptional regulator YafY